MCVRARAWQAYSVLSDPEKRRVDDATGEVDMADFDMDEFLSSGVLGDFFMEMMAETGELRLYYY